MREKIDRKEIKREHVEDKDILYCLYNLRMMSYSTTSMLYYMVLSVRHICNDGDRSDKQIKDIANK
jgi:hypothetical protein